MVIHKEMFWPRVCAALGQPGLAADPRFDTADKREQNCRDLVRIPDGLLPNSTSPTGRSWPSNRTSSPPG